MTVHDRNITVLLFCTLPFWTIPGCETTEQEQDPVNIILDRPWLFAVDSERRGTSEEWFSPNHDKISWDSVRVPGSWENYPGMERYDGHGWFARTFHLDRTDDALSIHFAGVDDDATVWLNGVEVGSHEGYSEPFVVDVTAAVRTGENLLVVRVVDHGGGGGIYGPVTLADSTAADSLMKGTYHDLVARESPAWVRDAVIYEVYLRSFSKEGTFRGLEKDLPRLKELGVSVLWLMPIHPVGIDRRKGTLGSPYAVRDFYDVNPEFGTMEDFRSLVNATHLMGMKLIIDLVINHTAWDNPLVTEHPDWYTRDASGSIIPPNADWTDVADLDYAHSDLREWMSAMMEFWVRDVGIDGYRCDVAELVPTDFWEQIRDRLDAIKPVMMLSEGSLPEHHIKAFDLTYSWNIYDGLQPLLDGSKPATFLDKLLTTEELRFPRGSLRLRFNTNHDKNAWDEPAINKFGPDGLMLTAVLVNTIPGVPLIYTGEEVGNDRRLDLFEKVDVDWGKSSPMGSLLERLSGLRRKGTALTSGRMRKATTQADDALYAFLRSSDDENLLIILNFSREARECRAILPGDLGESTLKLTDLLSDEVSLKPAGQRELMTGAIQGHGFRIYSVSALSGRD